MKRWYEILWGSREEEDIERRVQEGEQKLHGMGDITDEPSYPLPLLSATVVPVDSSNFHHPTKLLSLF